MSNLKNFTQSITSRYIMLFTILKKCNIIVPRLSMNRLAMAVTIRLARAGRKKKPFYHVVVADPRSSRDGKFKEKVGTYNPLLSKDHKERVILNMERVQYWVSVGAKQTETVARLIKNHNTESTAAA